MGPLDRPDAAARVAVIIPVFNHPARLQRVIEETLSLGLPLVLVDDGSTDESVAILDGFLERPGVTLLRHPTNLGKGAALRDGFRAAAPFADWALTLDADGQHPPAEARRLLAFPSSGERAIVIGRRLGMDKKATPWTSRWGRGFSNFWVWAAGGVRVSDSQSGFRLYPLPEVLELGTLANRFQFEVEVLALAAWNGLPIREVPVRVVYQPGRERVSHFRPWLDFLRNSETFTRLICRRLLDFFKAHRGERG